MNHWYALYALLFMSLTPFYLFISHYVKIGTISLDTSHICTHKIIMYHGFSDMETPKHLDWNFDCVYVIRAFELTRLVYVKTINIFEFEFGSFKVISCIDMFRLLICLDYDVGILIMICTCFT